MSTSPAQLAANAANAQHSTGPRTPEGKTRSSQNASKHGLTAREIVIAPGEQEEFDDLLADLPSRRQTPRRHPANSVQSTRRRRLEPSPHRPHGSRALRRLLLQRSPGQPRTPKPARPSRPPPHPHRANLPSLPQGAEGAANQRRHSRKPSRTAPQKCPTPRLRKRNCKTNPIPRSARSAASAIVSQSALGRPAPTGC